MSSSSPAVRLEAWVMKTNRKGINFRMGTAARHYLPLDFGSYSITASY